MNRRARLRLRGMASLADAAQESTPAGGGLDPVERRELCDVPVETAGNDGVVGRADDAGGAANPGTSVVGITGALDGTEPRNAGTERAATADGAVEDVESDPGQAGGAGERSTTELDGGGPTVNRGRALRALRMARALRLAIALGLSPGAGVE